MFTIYNNDLGTVRFGIDDSGNYGYKKVGADTIYPFSSGFDESGVVYKTTLDNTQYKDTEWTSAVVGHYYCIGIAQLSNSDCCTFSNLEILAKASIKTTAYRDSAGISVVIGKATSTDIKIYTSSYMYARVIIIDLTANL